MTNVKLEMVCEFEGKRYRFVEDTWKDYDRPEHCERRCAFYSNKECPRIQTKCDDFPICYGVNYGHWEEIKNEKEK